MDNNININISKVNYLKGVFKMIDKSNKKFWDKFAKLYAPFMKKDKGAYDRVCEYISSHLNKDMDVLELACGFRVIIVIEANSYVNTRSSRLLPKFKTQKINSWCAA